MAAGPLVGALSALLALALLAPAGCGHVSMPPYRQPGMSVNLPEGPWRAQARDVQWRGNNLCARLRRFDGSIAPRTCVAVQPGQSFENVDGAFAVEITETLPYGTWVATARNIRFEGQLLFATLRRNDLSWADTYTYVEDLTQTFENVDGEFRLMGQSCAIMGECLFGYILKRNASHIYCTGKFGDPVGLHCNQTLDRDTCCDERMPCANITTCPEGTLPALDDFCADVLCDEDVDMATCCIREDVCSAMPAECRYATSYHCLPGRCLDGYVLREQAATIQCGYECSAVEHRDLCCEPAEQCSNLTQVVCPNGYYFNASAYCAGTTCEESRDLGVCCQEALSCEHLECPHGFVAFNDSTFCDGTECVLERDRDLCCYPAMPCSNLTCSFGYTALPDTYCADSFCDAAVDTASCCKPQEPCGALGNVTCEEGYLNLGDFCASVACVPEDVDRCCQAAAPCSTYACPLGYNPRQGQVYCLSASCQEDRDTPVCCEVAAPCDGSACQYGFVASERIFDENGSTVLYCSNTTCNPAVDNDVCCDAAAPCVDHYSCPHGYTLRIPGTYCDGVTCVQSRDRDACCEPAAPCTELECGIGYVHVLDMYCQLTSCDYTTDFSTCCTRGLAMQYFRFTPSQVRNPASAGPVVQIAEFYMYFVGERVSYDTATAYAPDGNYPANEGPPNLLDSCPFTNCPGSITYTKWLDVSLGGFTIDLGAQMGVGNYSFLTGNDEEARDPVSWTMEGSADGSFFVVLDTVANAHGQVPSERLTETAQFGIDVPCAAPGGIADANATSSCAEGPIVASGANCTAQCAAGFGPSTEVLTCVQGELAPSNFSCG